MFFQVGDRVRLGKCNDPYVKIPVGILGTVVFVDASGPTVKWDNGITIGIIESAGDRIEKIEKEKE